MSSPRRSITGIRVRHRGTCAARTGGRCNCSPSYEASVFSVRDEKKIRKTFPTLVAAKDWRAATLTAVRRGTLRASSPVTLQEAAEEWLTGAAEGTIRSRSGTPFKPSTLRIYRQSLRTHVLPALRDARISDIGVIDIQDLADELLAAGADAATVRNAIAPLRVIFRRAVSRGQLGVNPTAGLELPAPRGSRERIAPPAEAAELIEALAPHDRGSVGNGDVCGAAPR